MAEILGLVEAAASVELYLRVMRCCWRMELEARIGAALLARSWRAQHWAAYLQEIDMAKKTEEEVLRNEAGYWPVAALGWCGIGLAIGAACCRESRRRDFFGRRSKSLPARKTHWLLQLAGG